MAAAVTAASKLVAVIRFVIFGLCIISFSFG